MAKAKAKQTTEESEWRDRIIEFRKMRVGDILPHPLQHKTHPEKQNSYLRGNLKETGKVDVLRAYYSERNEGKLTFFDGHGRRSLRPGEIWNIAICDLNDAEADRELLVFDAIGGYAQVERDLLDTLLRETSTGEAALQELMSELAAQSGLYTDEAPGSERQHGEKPEESTEDYADRSIKRVTLFFGLTEYDEFVTRLNSVCEAEGVDNHTDAVVRLLERYEQN